MVETDASAAALYRRWRRLILLLDKYVQKFARCLLSLWRWNWFRRLRRRSVWLFLRWRWTRHLRLRYHLRAIICLICARVVWNMLRSFSLTSLGRVGVGTVVCKRSIGVVVRRPALQSERSSISSISSKRRCRSGHSRPLLIR